MLARSTAEQDRRNNNFGILRLLFASLVIVSHSAELVDGNRSREILTGIFGTLSFGEFAVDGFFIISGYLVTKSFIGSETIRRYFLKRLARIYPGYAVSFVVCAFVLAPLVGATALFSTWQLKKLLFEIVLLRPPDVAGSFAGLHYPALNGPMWTIAYEFRCYILAAAVGLLGMYRKSRRALFVLAVAVLLILNAADVLGGGAQIGGPVLGFPKQDLRFAAVFGAGASYYLLEDLIPLKGSWALLSLAFLIALMFRQELAELALCTFGLYFIFWIAFKARVTWLSRLTNRTDLSYGLYLYGWPVQSVIIWTNPTIDPWLLCGLTLVAAGIVAYGSWVLVENPCLRLVHKNRPTAKSLGAAGQKT
jgi:peptidoglycan/LPS O-acetylase OafA/YrhL